MKRIKLLRESLEVEDGILFRSYFYKGKRILSIDFRPRPVTCSFIICSAKSVFPEILSRTIFEIKSLHMLPDIVVVVGSEQERQLLRRLFGGEFIKVVVNPRKTETVYTSIKLGSKAVSTNSSHIFVLFGKQETNASVMRKLLDSANASGKKITMPVFSGKKGHPLVFSSTIRSELLDLRKEKGLPYLVKKYAGEIEYVEFG